MKKNLVILTILTVVTLFFYLGRKRKNPSRSNLKNIPDTPINKICLKVSNTEDLYYCLAVVNKNSEYCRNLEMPNQKKLCQGIAARDVSYCREINETKPREMCFNELAVITENIDYCDETENKEHCYFNFITNFYWAGQAEKIKTEHCNKFPAQSPDRPTCFALKEKNGSLCRNNSPTCLTFFKKDLSFCATIKPEDKMKCIRDRAIIAQNPAICEKAVNSQVKDDCYFGYVSHFDPDISLCEKIKDKQLKNMCYTSGAITLAKQNSLSPK